MASENMNYTTSRGERVTSTYAEIYFHDDYCLSAGSNVAAIETENLVQDVRSEKEWISPSDFLTDIVKLHPPFTSKVTRGVTHEGILAIGNEVIDKERTIFCKSLNKLLQDNDASWNHILTYEKQEIIKKVNKIYQNIFNYKSSIMKNEITLFYEKTLQDLEKHLKKEVSTVLLTVYASIISESNKQIQEKLEAERKKLERILETKYVSEISKIKKYYSLLLHNELYRNNKLINKAIHERNDAINAFYKQVEADRITSTMYVMSLERKKCKIQKIQLQSLHTFEFLDKLKHIEENTNIIEDLKQKYVPISDVNKESQKNIEKILHLFLKFITFSLKIIPEQSSFLLCMEELVVLQLKEIHNNPNKMTNILINDELESNNFKFEQLDHNLEKCDKKPFVLVGELNDPAPKQYGSREILPSNVDLPFMRVGRQFVYAKCHGFEQIQNILDSQKCKCRILQTKTKSETNKKTKDNESTTSTVKSESSLESLFLANIEGLHDCPVRKCTKWVDKYYFPNLVSYLDYSEENFRRVTAILGSDGREEPSPSLINPKTIAYSELPFSATKEPFHSIGTQYSSQEDLNLKLPCPCIEKFEQEFQSYSKIKRDSAQELNEILSKRRRSLGQLISKNPNLQKFFIDENYDCTM